MENVKIARESHLKEILIYILKLRTMLQFPMKHPILFLMRKYCYEIPIQRHVRDKLFLFLCEYFKSTIIFNSDC